MASALAAASVVGAAAAITAREGTSGNIAAGVVVVDAGEGVPAGSAAGWRLAASSYFPGICMVHPTIAPIRAVPANHHFLLPILGVSMKCPVPTHDFTALCRCFTRSTKL